MKEPGTPESVPIPTSSFGARADTRTLEELEDVIRRGLQTFIQVGGALLSIRERGLYREKGYPTFEQYAREEWGISKQHAHRMMRATTAVGELSGVTRGLPLPPTERHARPLTRIKDPVARTEVWSRVLEEAGGVERVTGPMVEEQVGEHLKTGKPAMAEVRRWIREKIQGWRGAGRESVLARLPDLEPVWPVEQLGRATIAMTLGKYSHYLPAMGRAADDGMDAALG